jgi:hypothetical protein
VDAAKSLKGIVKIRGDMPMAFFGSGDFVFIVASVALK